MIFRNKTYSYLTIFKTTSMDFITIIKALSKDSIAAKCRHNLITYCLILSSKVYNLYIKKISVQLKIKEPRIYKTMFI